MKIYTKTGDDGSTGLFGGARVAKDDLRVQAYGAVDELNSALGVSRAALRAEPAGPAQDPLDALLQKLQEDLFVLGADLASPREAAKEASYLPRLEPGAIAQLEDWIDEHESHLARLTNFILPGGSPAGSALHLARAVCRRAERATVTLAGRTAIGLEPVQYLNRLGDLLFVLARYANSVRGVREVEWAPRREREGS